MKKFIFAWFIVLLFIGGCSEIYDDIVGPSVTSETAEGIHNSIYSNYSTFIRERG